MSERKGPSDSATVHPVGKVLTGNDGRQWRVIETAAGVHRWSRMKDGAATTGGFCAPCAAAAVAVLGGEPAAAPRPPPKKPRAPAPKKAAPPRPPPKKSRATAAPRKAAPSRPPPKKPRATATPPSPPKKPAQRKGPSESATKFTVGATRVGSDGKEWRVVETKTGVKRWQRKGQLKLSARARKGIPNPKWEGGHYVGWA